ncbi:MAG: hypothetical protein KAQ74_01170 [Dehalococcoidia bacterium]|nr:hypothetical protein [Dehalococcoidia bacterium]
MPCSPLLDIALPSNGALNTRVAILAQVQSLRAKGVALDDVTWQRYPREEWSRELREEIIQWAKSQTSLE